MCLVVWTADDGAPPGDVRAAVLASGVVVAGALFAARGHDGPWSRLVASISATTYTVLAIGTGGDGYAPVFLVPVAVYTAYALPRRLAVGAIGFIGVALAPALHAGGVEHPLPAWAVTVLTVASAAYVVRVLRRRLRTVIAQLDASARTDHLTGVLNRRGLDERLGQELARAMRVGGSLGVIVGDVDRFKALNDEHGHPAGDDGLRSVARVLASEARTTDVVGRLGGDEFVLVLPDTDLQGAESMLVRIRRGLRAAPGPAPLGMTFGVSTSPADGHDAATLLSRADERLYASRRRSRQAV